MLGGIVAPDSSTNLLVSTFFTYDETIATAAIYLYDMSSCQTRWKFYGNKEYLTSVKSLVWSDDYSKAYLLSHSTDLTTEHLVVIQDPYDSRAPFGDVDVKMYSF